MSVSDAAEIHHGEYKVPVGKLVVVDLEVKDDKLANVQVSGDFFLEPDEALADLTNALNGLDADSSVADIIPALQKGLRPEAQLIGFTPESVAIAVRRAVGKATTWDDHVFDVIGPEVLPPVMHVALDQVILDEVAAGTRPPTFRFWDWDSPLTVIGSFQSVRNEIDPEGAEKFGIDVVRRISGGGAMFMEPGNCITYSLVVPTSLVEGLSFEQAYAFLDDWVIGALKSIGVKARYVPLNDIASEVGKIGGAAQKRIPGAVLHHVTMAYDIDAERMTQVLRIGREKLSDKGTKSAQKRVDPMRSQTGLSRTEIIDAFQRSFTDRYHSNESAYSAAELDRAQDLVEQKFGTQEWTYRVP